MPPRIAGSVTAFVTSVTRRGTFNVFAKVTFGNSSSHTPPLQKGGQQQPLAHKANNEASPVATSTSSAMLGPLLTVD